MKRKRKLNPWISLHIACRKFWSNPVFRVLFVVICAISTVQIWVVLGIYTMFSTSDPIGSMETAKPYSSSSQCLYLNYEKKNGDVQMTKYFFYKNFVTKEVPVVMIGGIKHWLAIKKWNDRYLKDKIGDREVLVAIGNKTDQSFGLMEKTIKKKMPFDKFVDLMNDDESGIQYYLNLQREKYTDDSGKTVHEPVDLASIYFKEDYEEPPLFSYRKLREANFWMGPDQLVSRLHHDSSENLLCQVHGIKKFVVYPPSMSQHLYPFEGQQQHFSQVDIENPDYTKFPKLRNAKPTECIVNAGDILFVPPHWWHQVYSFGHPNLAINFWYEKENPIQAFKTALRMYFLEN